MLNWLNTKGWKYIIFISLGYLAHVFFETFVLTQILAYFGMSMPVLV